MYDLSSYLVNDLYEEFKDSMRHVIDKRSRACLLDESMNRQNQNLEFFNIKSFETRLIKIKLIEIKLLFLKRERLLQGQISNLTN